MASQNIGSRSEVKKYINKGNVKVNGIAILKANTNINENSDVVTCHGVQVFYKKHIYIMLNKPKNVVSATVDNVSKTVIELLDDKLQKLGLFPVGRLDKDTEGLLILTNNGDFAHNTLAPKKHVTKKYIVEVDNELNETHIETFKNGIVIDSDYVCKEATLSITNATLEHSECVVEITEGKFHQIKKMFKSLNMNVVYLKRISFGELELDNTLELGQYRELTESELISLSKYM